MNNNIQRDLSEVNADLVRALRERDAEQTRLRAQVATLVAELDAAQSDLDAVLAVLTKVCEHERLTYGGPDTAPLVGYPFGSAAQMAAAVAARLTAERDDYRAKWKALSRQAGAGVAEWSNLLAERDRLLAALKLLIDLSRGVAGVKMRQYTDAEMEQLFAALLQADAALGAAQMGTPVVNMDVLDPSDDGLR